jgi:hypothetical protein
MALERWLEKIENVQSVEDYLDNGGTVSGPSSLEFAARTRTAYAKFAGRILPTGRQATQLLNDPALQVYPGRGMHCVFDSSKSLCTTHGESEPHLGQCRSGCSNIARTDDDIVELQHRVHRLSELAEADGLAPSVRYQRVSLVLGPLRAAMDEHERVADDAE